ncbi:hypothetical protein LXD69_01555 [Flavobacterium sediminilitoris]|uniref:DUF3139 domain-containing protein n=1 Tax=Flavobacterium sediminilitoris TaxID=2024526 RepID=A0ABY4HMY6_9FLAO|nr:MULTISPECIES: hypothetical protein [Flavobacterium]UOX34213.1 hypothetical protein LXD69_01555 [Flavobacterium sediminilitoris]
MKKHIYKFIILGFLLVLGYLVFKGYNYKKEINENSKTTIAKFLHYKNFPKTKKYYFKYFVNEKRFVNSYGQTQKGFHKNKGKFYSIKYSKNDPNKIIVNFDKEITDTVAILEAGFSIEDIE